MRLNMQRKQRGDYGMSKSLLTAKPLRAQRKKQKFSHGFTQIATDKKKKQEKEGIMG